MIMKILGLDIDKNRYRETVPQSLESFIKKQIAAGNDPKTTYFSKCDVIHGYSPTMYANHIDNNPDMADYSHMQATDWVKCNIDGSEIIENDERDIKEQKSNYKIITSLLIIIFALFLIIPELLSGNILSAILGFLCFIIPLILIFRFFYKHSNMSQHNNGRSNEYDLTKAVGVYASDLLENTGFKRLLIDYDEVKINNNARTDNDDSDTTNYYIDRHEINMIIFQPSYDGKRRQYRMLAATTDEEYAIRNLTSNIYIVLETEGDKVRLLVPDASMQAMFAASSIRTPSNTLNNMMQSAAAKGKIGLMVEDPRIYNDITTNNIWLCDTFNDYNHDGIQDDKQMLLLDNKNNKMPSNAYTTI